MSDDADTCTDCGQVISLCDHAAARLLDPERGFSAGVEADLQTALAASEARAAELAAANQRLREAIDQIISAPYAVNGSTDDILDTCLGIAQRARALLAEQQPAGEPAP
jgi:hypothetical protein